MFSNLSDDGNNFSVNLSGITLGTRARWNLVMSQSRTLFISETANHVASLNNRKNRGLDVTNDQHRCKHISEEGLIREGGSKETRGLMELPPQLKELPTGPVSVSPLRGFVEANLALSPNNNRNQVRNSRPRYRK